MSRAVRADPICEGEPAVVRAAISNPRTGVSLVIADVDSIELRIFDLGGAAPDEATWGADPRPEDVIFDVLLTDWTGFGGYNFRHDTPLEEAPIEGGHTYRVQYELFLAAGGKIIVAVEQPVEPVW